MIRNRYTAAINDNPWWLAGGIHPDACVGAFNAKAAQSLAHSKFNLGRPSLDLGTGTPGWSVTNGWEFNATARINIVQGLGALMPTVSTNASWIIKISGVTVDATTRHPFMIRQGSFYDMQILANTGYVKFENVANYSSEIAVTDSVYACGGNGCYINGVLIYTMSPASGSSSWVGGSIGGTNSTNTFKGNVQAAAFYRVGLDDRQINALTNAMNAL